MIKIVLLFISSVTCAAFVLAAQITGDRVEANAAQDARDAHPAEDEYCYNIETAAVLSILERHAKLDDICDILLTAIDLLDGKGERGVSGSVSFVEYKSSRLSINANAYVDQVDGRKNFNLVITSLSHEGVIPGPHNVVLSWQSSRFPESEILGHAASIVTYPDYAESWNESSELRRSLHEQGEVMFGVAYGYEQEWRANPLLMSFRSDGPGVSYRVATDKSFNPDHEIRFSQEELDLQVAVSERLIELLSVR